MRKRASISGLASAAALAVATVAAPVPAPQAPVAPSSVQQTQQNTKQQAPAPTPVRTNASQAVFLSRHDLPLVRRREPIWLGYLRPSRDFAGRKTRKQWRVR